tara:strand:- start:3336 stop:4844 length:1509 start_codon:yes stop_codon:yes gene_type:complete
MNYYTKATQQAIDTWGTDTCLEALRLHTEDGEGASTISGYLSNGDTINGAKLLDAGREIAAASNPPAPQGPQVTYTTAKDTKRARRVWIEGTKLANAGFPAGTKYDLAIAESAKRIIIAANPAGTKTVSSCKRGAKSRPIIDLHSKVIENLYAADARIRITFEQDLITIEEHHEDTGRTVREDQFKRNAKNGTLREASLFTGGGVSTQAIHEGLGGTGTVKYIAECEMKYVESAGANCLAVDDSTAVLVGKVEEIEDQFYTDCDVLSFSMPCTKVSKAGKAKHGESEMDSAEVFGVVRAIRASNPGVIISENVVAAQTSPVYQLLRAELRRAGYKVFDQILDSSHTDSFENRPRYWLVAISEGIAPEHFEVSTVARSGVTLAELLDDDETVASLWADNGYLNAKEERDLENGHNFKRQLLTGVETACGVIGRFYNKKRSTEPFVTRGTLERLFTPAEHARVKSIPANLIAGLPKSTAHEIMGQSVDYRQPLRIAQTIAALFA